MERRKSSIVAEQKFQQRVNELGGQVIGKYIKNNIKVECICINNHKCYPFPTNVIQGGGLCNICVGHDSATAEKKFFEKITRLGGIVIGQYQGTNVPVKCLCPNNHECAPRPKHILAEGGMCRVCANTDFAAAEKVFLANIEKLGGIVLGQYQGAHLPVKCVCKNGHECTPRPQHLRNGGGMCKTCAGRDTAAAEAAFRTTIIELGGQVIGQYRGSHVPVKCICSKNHDCAPAPSDIQKGCGLKL